MQWLYLASLVLSLSCLVLIDKRYRLAFFYDARRTALTLAVAIGLFIVWDVLGITLGIFSQGESPFMLPLSLVPNFPIEELFFLALLTYVTLLTYRWVSQRGTTSS